MLAALLLCALMSHGGEGTEARDDVSVIELNHYVNEKGGLVLTQWIFWDWTPQHRRFQVRAWRLYQPGEIVKAERDGRISVRFYDPTDKLQRHITAVEYRSTVTGYDPEMVEREYLPREDRIGLSRPLNSKQGIADASFLPTH